MNEIYETNSTTVPASAGTVTDILYQSYAYKSNDTIGYLSRYVARQERKTIQTVDSALLG